jgi:serine protease AprX
MSPQHDHLPIKVIIPQEEDMRAPKGGGGEKKAFAELFDYDASRRILLDNLTEVERQFEPIFTKTNLPAVARITLREQALAKSHRPDKLFTARTCHIIGGEDFDQLLVSVNPKTLKRLVQTVETGTAEDIRNDVAKVVSVEPFTDRDALGDWTTESLEAYLREHRIRTLKLRLFNHRNPELNQTLFRALTRMAEQGNIAPPKELRYAPSLRIFQVQTPRHQNQLAELASFVGTQSLDVFEQFAISAQSTVVQPLTEDDLPGPVAGEDYPVVGIIDTGTDPNNPHLQAWVKTRDDHLVRHLPQDNKHGSLVAGMIVNGRGLNHDHDGFPSGKARIVDVVAIPKGISVSETDLHDALRYAFETHRDVRIWNMSLNSLNCCKSDRFSTFAVALDQLQDEFGTLIVNSAGNFGDNPAHKWPRPDLSDRDRIFRPAESLRALTVGSIAHLAHNGACAQPGQPSPFTRKGPGSACVPKPEITHIGGNTDRNFRFSQMGVLSVDNAGNIAETVGTSFAAPSVALLAAQLSQAMEEPPSRHLLKAFLIHAAVLHSPEITAEGLHYTGFGKPPTVEEILRCRPWESTLVFDLNLPFARRHFHKADFPVPDCLKRDGRVYGEFIMTLVYDPPVDADDGAAYSQVNVNASLGVCWSKDGKDKYARQVMPYPDDEDFAKLYEKYQIQHGFKWSPVKVFRRQFKNGMESRGTWRITIDASPRKQSFSPIRQPVALIATIRDPDKQLPVYDEVIAMMNVHGWVTQNLRIKDSVRVRLST